MYAPTAIATPTAPPTAPATMGTTFKAGAAAAPAPPPPSPPVEDGVCVCVAEDVGVCDFDSDEDGEAPNESDAVGVAVTLDPSDGVCEAVPVGEGDGGTVGEVVLLAEIVLLGVDVGEVEAVAELLGEAPSDRLAVPVPVMLAVPLGVSLCVEDVDTVIVAVGDCERDGVDDPDRELDGDGNSDALAPEG